MWEKINVSIARINKWIWWNAAYKRYDKSNQEKLVEQNWTLK